MSIAEKSGKKESSVFIHRSGRIAHQSDLNILQEVAANVGLSLKVVAKAGQSYTPIASSTRRFGEETNGVLPTQTKIVAQGQVYISLTRFSLRARDFTTNWFDKDVRALKSSSGIL